MKWAPDTVFNSPCLAQYSSTKLLLGLGPSDTSRLSYVLAILVVVTAVRHSLIRGIHSANICWMYMFNEALNMNKKTKRIRQTLLLLTSMCLLGWESTCPAILRIQVCMCGSFRTETNLGQTKQVGSSFLFWKLCPCKNLGFEFLGFKIKICLCHIEPPWSQPFVTTAPGEVCISRRLVCGSRTERLWSTQLQSPELSRQPRPSRDRWGHCL
jgi:hypothetical protein